MPEPHLHTIAAVRQDLLGRVAGELPEDCRGRVRFACALAERAHAGQTRDEGSPYVFHPLRVALMLAADLPAIRRDEALLASADPCDIFLIALLHDVLEDAPDVLSADDWKTLGDAVLEGVRLLTRAPNLSKVDYYKRLGEAPRHVRLVKLADRLDNLQGIHLSAVAGKKQKKIAETLGLVLPFLRDDASPLLAHYSARVTALVERLLQGG